MTDNDRLKDRDPNPDHVRSVAAAARHAVYPVRRQM